jgi:hypothetical protein
MKADEAITGVAAARESEMVGAQAAHTASLQAQLTVEEQSNLVKKLKIATIQQLLTAQQSEYLSNLGITTSSANYETVAMSVLSVDQRAALAKTDLSSKSAIYQAALAKEVDAKTANNAATLAAMRTDVKAAAAKLESARMSAMEATAAVDAANYEIYRAKRTGNATAIATAEKKLEGAVDNEALARKAALAASSDFYAKKKLLETTATKASTIASETDSTVKTVQAASTSLLTTITDKCTLAMKALWTSMKTNPIGWIVTVIGLAATAFTLFKSKTDEAGVSEGTLEHATKTATDEFAKQSGKVDALNKIIHDGNAPLAVRKQKLDELKAIIPGYNAQLSKEGQITRDNTQAIKEYLVQLEKQIQLKAAEDDLVAAYKQKRTLSKQLKADQQAADQADAARNTTYNNAGAFIPTPIVGSKESGAATSQLNKTKAALADVNSNIADLTKEIETNSQAVTKSHKKIETINSKIAETRGQIKNLKNEIHNLRTGKESSDDILTDIANKEKELKEAEGNLETLTGKSTKNKKINSTSQQNAQDNYKDKELKAELDAEKSRISIMEDGYEKRKAQLDLQHKQTMAQIDKEQMELTEARKKAGKGGLSQSDTNNFNTQRISEEENYNKQIQKLFDGEIEYKKAQYDLYFKWVKNMGSDVANTQFAKLIQGGSSFKDYLENEIKKLNDKRASGKNLSEGEANNYINLKVQYDEVTGAKTAMDQFKDSLTQAISNAKTLNEKLEAIGKAKEKIQNGTSGLVGADEKAAGTLFANQKEDETNKEVAKLVDQYKDYAQQRLDIEKKYNDDIKLLTDQRNAAQVKGDTDTTNKLNSAIAKATKDKGTSLIKNDLDALKNSPEYIRAFEDLKRTSTETLNDLLGQFEAAKEAAAKTMDPEQLREYTNTMMGIVNELTDRNPFQAIAKGKKELAEAERDLKNAQRDLKNIQNSPDKGTDKEVQAIKRVNAAKDNYINKNHQVNQADKKVTDSIKDLCDNISKVGDSVGGQTGEIVSLIGDIGSYTMGAIQGFQSASEASSSAISTLEKASVILTIISAAFQIANKIQSMFGANYDEYNKAKQAYQDYIAVLDDVIDKQKELVASMDNKNAVNSYKYAISLIKEETDAARELGKERLNAGASAGSHSIGVRQRKDMTDQAWQQAQDALGADLYGKISAGRMEGLFDLTAEQLEKLKSEAPVFWAKLDGDARDYLQEIIDSNDKLDEMKSKLNESLTGVDFDSFSGDILSDLEDVDAKAEDVFNNISEYMRKALIQNMWKNQFKDQIQKWYQMWSDAMNPDGDGGSTITTTEQAALDTLKNSIVTGATDAAKKINDQFNTTESQDALEGAVRSMSEETGSLVAGRLNAVIINQGDENNSLRQILLCNIKIVNNTGLSANELTEIHSILKDMNSKGSSLLSKGIS